MFNYATAPIVTHVLLIDKETTQQVHELGKNARIISDCYNRLLSQGFGDNIGSKYYILFVVPYDSSLATCCEEVCNELKSTGINSDVARIKNEDNYLWQGKIGLLSCCLWRLAGVVLLNEIPISEKQAKKILQQANRFRFSNHQLILPKQRFLQPKFQFGVVRSVSSIGSLLRGGMSYLPDGHSVSDIFKVMKDNCHGEELYLV